MLKKNSKVSVPLCVDLDGTLISTDLFIESLILSFRQSVYLGLRILLKALQSRSAAKSIAAQKTSILIDQLPYNKDLITWLEKERKKGRRLVLATAAARLHAEAVANYLGLFDEIISSEENINLKREKKREIFVKRFGDKGFDYVGDSKADLAVWRSARQAILIDPSSSLEKKVRTIVPVAKVFRRQTEWKDWIHQVRIYQWSKNLLLFLPVLGAHRISDPNTLMKAVFGFFCFCLFTSGSYVVNDLFGLQSDRQHPTKQNRPIASGAIKVRRALMVVPLLILPALFMAYFLSWRFFGWLCFYGVMETLYSIRLKELLMIDVMLLAFLYILRVVAGGAVTGIKVSFWLMAFSIFFFLSLALLKRYVEVAQMGQQRVDMSDNCPVRGYRSDDEPTLRMLGIASGYTAVLILAFYIDSDDVRAMYSNPRILWLLCPLLIYWISRLWLLAGRNDMHENPIVFVLSDKWSYLLGMIGLAIILIFA
ncbi:MAG: UbiA family prenyltransferase [Patescibacteria group bacterium]